MRFIDLFCGIGGFRLGLERANQIGIDTQQGDGDSQGQFEPQPQGSRWGKFQEFRCVWANDNDKYACQIYRKHWGDKGDRQSGEWPRSTECSRSIRDSTSSQGNARKGNKDSNWDKSSRLHEGDIRAVDPSTIPGHDLLCAGFPCQSFSIAGKRKGFEDTRGTLFFEICRVLRAKRPGYLFLENVKGLLSHDEGRTFQAILESLDDLGYDCQWEVLNSKNFGVPQNRERVFIIGHTRGITRPKVFPIGKTGEMGEGSTWAYAIDSNIGQGVRGHRRRTMILHNIYGGFKETTPRVFEDYSPTIRTPEGGGHLPSVLEGTRIRRLTPLECERLQGFPDGWTEGISDTQRYRALGNAVTVNVIEAIGYEICKGR